MGRAVGADREAGVLRDVQPLVRRRRPTSRPARDPATRCASRSARRGPQAERAVDVQPGAVGAARAPRPRSSGSHAPVLTLPACAHTIVGPSTCPSARSSSSGRMRPWPSTGTRSGVSAPRPSMRSAVKIELCASSPTTTVTAGAPCSPRASTSQPTRSSTAWRATVRQRGVRHLAAGHEADARARRAAPAGRAASRRRPPRPPSPRARARTARRSGPTRSSASRRRSPRAARRRRRSRSSAARPWRRCPGSAACASRSMTSPGSSPSLGKRAAERSRGAASRSTGTPTGRSPRLRGTTCARAAARERGHWTSRASCRVTAIGVKAGARRLPMARPWGCRPNTFPIRSTCTSRPFQGDDVEAIAELCRGCATRPEDSLGNWEWCDAAELEQQLEQWEVATEGDAVRRPRGRPRHRVLRRRVLPARRDRARPRPRRRARLARPRRQQGPLRGRAPQRRERARRGRAVGRDRPRQPAARRRSTARPASRATRSRRSSSSSATRTRPLARAAGRAPGQPERPARGARRSPSRSATTCT